MSLRILIQPARINSWITGRQGTPARRRGTDDELQILFDKPNGQYEPLTCDELCEAMKSQHVVLLVDEDAGSTFHRFVERG